MLLATLGIGRDPPSESTIRRVIAVDGKTARVVIVDGGQIPGGPAARRTFVPSPCTCDLGGLLFDLSPLFAGSPWKRGWCDKLAGTVVIVGESPTWLTDSGQRGERLAGSCRRSDHDG